MFLFVYLILVYIIIIFSKDNSLCKIKEWAFFPKLRFAAWELRNT